MLRFLVVITTILTVTASSMSSEGSSVEVGTLGVGFDEGLLLRVQLLDKLTLHAGFGLYCRGADTVFHQPLSRISWKLGSEYSLLKFNKLNVGAFGEWRQEMNQEETSRAAGVNTLRYNQWNTIFRVGIRPEWFILERLSIDYKIGLQYTHHGPTFKLNSDQSGLESKKDDFDDVGTYSGRSLFSNESALLLNIGFTVYLMKLPFFN